MAEPWSKGMTESEALIRRRKLLAESISKIEHEIDKIDNRIDFLELNNKT